MVYAHFSITVSYGLWVHIFARAVSYGLWVHILLKLSHIVCGCKFLLEQLSVSYGLCTFF